MATQGWPGELSEASMVADARSIALYAEITNDFNPLHLDAGFAAKTPFGKPIAHGTMSLALVWEAVRATFGDAAMPGEAEIRFSAPVPVDTRITARGHCIDGEAGRYAFEVVREDGTVALSGTMTVMRSGGGAAA
jgi:3-hydroxybutyryl-CoA dehydratase